MTRANALYRFLLLCYPAAFRNEYGSQMLLMFAEQLGEARRNGSRLAQARLWMRAARDALTIAPKEHWHVMVQDIRYALRAMRARPGFAAVAIVSLALGIGANTAIFSLWNGVLHSPLPGVYKPGELVMLTNPENAGMWHGNSQGEREWLSYPEFEELRDHARSFSSVMASESSLSRWQVRFNGREQEETHGRLVSGAYFQLLGVKPALGHLFTAADDRGDNPYAVISYAYWQRRFGGSPDVLGKSFALRKAVLTIIGVTPREFTGETVGQHPDLWAPLRLQPLIEPGEDWLHETPPQKVVWLHVFGRLKPGVTPAQAEAEANSIFKAGLLSFYGGMAASAERRRDYLNQYLKIHPGGIGASETRGEFSSSLTALLAAVGLLLLIACTNLANLMLARGAGRKAEIALRVSLGASRGRLMRQLITESLVLAAMGAVCGLAAARLIHEAVVRLIVQSDRNFQMSFALDPVVLAFTLAVTVAAALLFGLLPAWQVTRSGAGAMLKEQSRGARGSPGGARWNRVLVSLQIALSLPLLASAGLLARTVFNLQHLDLGYPADRLILAGTESRIAGYDSRRSAELFRNLLAEIQRIPCVRAASFSHNGIFAGSNSGDPVEVEGYTRTGNDDRGSAWEMVGPGYFSTLGIPILLGREIGASEQAASPKVCVINEAFAKKFFAGRHPIGLHVTALAEGAQGIKRTVYQVVGVARNSRTQGLRGEIEPRLYMPITQPSGDNVKRANFVIRTGAENTAVLDDVRRVFQRIDPSLPILYARSIQDQIAPYTAPDRTTAQVAVVFGCVALALAAIGLYGVLSYAVARRTGEIAIRIAIGARPGRVIAMIVGETMRLLAAGIAAGLALAWVAVRLIAGRLYGVAPLDPLTLAFAIALLLAAALSAVYPPARRASRLDPVSALRQE